QENSGCGDTADFGCPYAQRRPEFARQETTRSLESCSQGSSLAAPLVSLSVSQALLRVCLSNCGLRSRAGTRQKRAPHQWPGQSMQLSDAVVVENPLDLRTRSGRWLRG